MMLKKIANKLFYSMNDMLLKIMGRNPDDWIRLGIIFLLIVACGVLGFKASQKYAFLSILLVVGFIGIILLLRRPEISIILLIPISFFTPWEVGTGTNVPFNFTFLFTIAIIGIWIFRTISSRIPDYLQTNSIQILSIIFIIETVISLVGGNIHWVINAQDQASLPAQIGGWLLYVLPIGILLYIQTNLLKKRWLKIVVWLFIVLGSIYIISLFPPFNFLSDLNLYVSRSTESMFWTWLAALAFGQFLYNKELHLKYKVALGLLTIAIIIAGLSTGRIAWTSGWLPPLLAIGTILWLRSWRFSLITTFIAIAIIGVSKTTFFTNLLISPNQYSITSRASTYPIMFELIKTNPIIGLGFANYSHYTSLFPISGYYVSFNSHNNYMDIIAQTGIVGLVLFLGLMISIGLYGWKLLKINKDGFSNGYIAACLGGLVGMLASGMLGDWFLPYLYNIGISGFRSSIFAWIFLGGLLALGRIIETPKKSFGKDDISITLGKHLMGVK